MAFEFLKSRKPVSPDPAELLGGPVPSGDVNAPRGSGQPLSSGPIDISANPGSISPEALSAMKDEAATPDTTPAPPTGMPPTPDIIKNLGDIQASAFPDTQPKLAPQGPQNPVLHALSRVIGLTGDQPKPGEMYDGPTSTAAKIANVTKFAGGVGTALAAAGGNMKPAELELQQQQLAATTDLHKAQMKENALYHTGMIENAADRNKNTLTTAGMRYGDDSPAAQQAAAKLAEQGLIKDPNTNEIRRATPEELSLVTKSKLDTNQSRMDRNVAAIALDKAKRDAIANPDSPQMQLKWYQARANMALAQRRMSIAEKGLDLRENADARAEDKFNAPSAPAQKILMTTRPIKDQVLDIMDKLETLKDNNTPGYFALPRIKYAAGIHDDSSDLAGSMSEIELSRPLEAARIMQGSSRAYAALQKGMVHTPDPWRDSPKQMYSKLTNIYNNLDDLETDAKAFGTQGNYKNGDVPNPPRSHATTKNPPNTKPGGGKDDSGGGQSIQMSADGGKTVWNVPPAKVKKFTDNGYSPVKKSVTK